MRKLVAAADDECREGIALIQARRRKRSDSPHRISGAIVGMGRPTIRHTPLTIALDRLIVTHVVVAACLVIHARSLAFRHTIPARMPRSLRIRTLLVAGVTTLHAIDRRRIRNALSRKTLPFWILSAHTRRIHDRA